MQFLFGWVIVGAGMVVMDAGFGAMFSLRVFLRPLSEAEGWLRTGISTAALLNFLGMGVASCVRRALSDRLGTCAVMLLGGILLGLGTVLARQVPTLAQRQVYFGVVVGFAAGSVYAPLTATITPWFMRHRSLAVALVSAELGVGSTPPPLAPERAAQALVDKGLAKQYEYARQLMQDFPYGQRRDYNSEDMVRFYAFRLHEAGMVKSSPQELIVEGTD
jgi:hypothetical protein